MSLAGIVLTSAIRSPEKDRPVTCYVGAAVQSLRAELLIMLVLLTITTSSPALHFHPIVFDFVGFLLRRLGGSSLQQRSPHCASVYMSSNVTADLCIRKPSWTLTAILNRYHRLVTRTWIYALVQNPGIDRGTQIIGEDFITVERMLFTSSMYKYILPLMSGKLQKLFQETLF